ncbi:ATP-dependent nuclease [Candidatus Hodarchaeum mangrovi]
MQLAKLSLRNFRSIANLSLSDLKSLNCFIGPHNSGKSNLLEGISVFWDGAFRAENQLQFPQEEVISSYNFENLLSYFGDSKSISGEFHLRVNDDIQSWQDNEILRNIFVETAKFYRYSQANQIFDEFLDLLTQITSHGEISHFVFNLSLQKELYTILEKKIYLQLRNGEKIPFPEEKVAPEIIQEFFSRAFFSYFQTDSDFNRSLHTNLLNLLHEKNYQILSLIEEFLQDVLSQRFHFELGARTRNNHQIIDVTIENAFTNPLWKISSSTKRIISLAWLLTCSPIGRIVIVDEPSLFLHPRGERALARKLEQFSRNHQIFFSTHSTRLLIGHAYLVDLHNGWTRIRPIKGEKTMKKVVNILGIQPSDSFGSDVVVFVEGRTDERVYRVFEDIIIGSGIRAAKNRVSFIPVGGWTNMKFVISIELLKSKFVRSRAVAITDGDILNSDNYDRVRNNWEMVFPKNTFFSLTEESIESLFLNNSVIFPRCFTNSDSITIDQLNEYIQKRRNRGIPDKAILIELLEIYYGKRYRVPLAEALAKKFTKEEIPKDLQNFFISQILS